jgi:hypothetical protein
MDFTKQSDKRLIDRAERQGRMSGAELERLVAELPDLDAQALRPGEAELEPLRRELASEAERRNERIERQLREPPRPQIQIRPVPLPEFED